MPDFIALSVLRTRPEVCIGQHGSLFVIVWRSTLSSDTIVDVTSAIEDRLADLSGPVSVLNIVTAEAGGNADARLFGLAAAAFKHFDERVLRCAIVVPELTATARAAVMGLLVLTNAPQRYLAFDALRLAFEWLDVGEAVRDAIIRFVRLP